MDDRVAERTKQIPAELTGLDGDLGRLGSVLAELESELSSVLTLPDPGSETAKLDDIGCKLAVEIKGYRQSVKRFIEAVVDLKNRLEV